MLQALDARHLLLLAFRYKAYCSRLELPIDLALGSYYNPQLSSVVNCGSRHQPSSCKQHLVALRFADRPWVGGSSTHDSHDYHVAFSRYLWHVQAAGAGMRAALMGLADDNPSLQASRPLRRALQLAVN